MLICMRTTLNIDDELMRDAKKAAIDRGTTLTRVIELALRQELAHSHGDRKYRLDLPTMKGEGEPKVDVSDRRAIYDALDPLD